MTAEPPAPWQGAAWLPVELPDPRLAAAHQSFCDAVLWPIFHELPAQLPLTLDGWEEYRKVNGAVAEQVVASQRPGDEILIHDHELMLVPGMVRAALPGARIVLSLHHPFPSPKTFRILPFRCELLEGLLGADVLTLPTADHVQRLLRTLTTTLDGLEVDDEVVSRGGRRVRAMALPLGVNPRVLASSAHSEAVERRLLQLRAPTAERGRRAMQTMVALDRLDRTRGIPRRLVAFERLLQDDPTLRERVRLLQVAIPPGGDSEEHRELEEQVQARVGRINGAFGTARWTPVHYMCRRPSFDEVLALYRAADIMLVTPTGDGLDLVADEFVAVRTDEDGVLVLSERAPAARELTEAMLVNPFDIQGTARALAHALTLGATERRRRMQALRARVFAGDAEHWTSELPRAPDVRPAVTAGPAPALPAAAARAALAAVPSSRPLVVLLDYDGTLVPFADRPLLAAPDAELLALLQGLSDRPETEVHIVSGRSRTSLESWLGHLPRLGLHAEHGAWSRAAGGAACERPVPPAVWRADVLDLMRKYCLEVPGSLLEQKASGLAWHYRTAEPHQGLRAVRELNCQLQKVVLDLPAQILLGDKVLEVRPRGIHKGLVVTDILARRPTGSFLAAGDDLTDEDLFAAMPAGALTIHVGSRPSRAGHRLPSPRALRDLLWCLTLARGWHSASGMAECHVPAEGKLLTWPSRRGHAGGTADAVDTRAVETTAMEHDG